MQSTINCLQHSPMQSARLSSRSVFGTAQLAPAATLRPVTRARRTAPQAFLRGYCGTPFAANRANQQILEQMLQQAAGMAATSSGMPSAVELPLAVDAADEGDVYTFRADIPGVQRSDLKVQTKDRKLSISGKRERASQPDESRKQRLERTFGKFSRQLKLPEDADCNSIKAKVDNGVLTVTISKLAKLPGVEDVQVDF